MSLTSDWNDPRLGRGAGGSGQNAAYLILSDEERAKGFVRPVRRSYKHVGRAICGDSSTAVGPDAGPGKLWACSDEPGHDGEHDLFTAVSPMEAERGIAGGCGGVTTMAQEIAETYAREPVFYGATFCCRCGTHLPVGARGEFVWIDVDGSELSLRVGE